VIRGRAVTIATPVLVAGAIAFATGATGLPQPVQNTLTVIDTVPSKNQLNDVFDGEAQALTNLSTIAQDNAADVGIRLRAIHALGKYCSNPCIDGHEAHLSLKTLIAETHSETAGSNVLLLRAAIETIGALHVSTDFDVIKDLGLLDHPSRDIRAATARALRDICNPSAITPLRVRYTAESTEQVKLAISEALRILGQCAATP
jgi:hypothetical protein